MTITSASVQDYLQAIYRLQEVETPVSTTALADRLDVAPPSVTGMVRKLQGTGFVEYVPYHGVVLTPAGEREALLLLRRHRLWELFLVEVLGLAWDEIHQEAHRLEHATSARVAEKLDEFLGRPEIDPHGQLIPSRDGTVPPRPRLTLWEVGIGCATTLIEVPDRDPALLRQLDHLDLHPGVDMRVISKMAPVGTLKICIGEAELTVDKSIAQQLLVTPADPGGEEENG